MFLLDNLSFRYKIPLRATVLVVATVFLLTGLLVVREQKALYVDLSENADLLATTLSYNLTTPLLQDDVWRAYEILRTPLRDLNERAKQRLPFAIILFDRDFRVMASSEPLRYTVLASPEDLLSLASLAPWVRDANAVYRPAPSWLQIHAPQMIDTGEDVLGKITRVQADGVDLGHLVLAYSKAGIHARSAELIRGVLVYTLGVLVVLLPITWYWGWRMASPLTQLAASMGAISQTLKPELLMQPATPTVSERYTLDELGQARQAFDNMLLELRHKAALEQEVMVNERMAAIGRLAAGVAHEINNPLGGMLNALDTYQRHGGDAAKVGKTLALLERGLQQIRDTVSALLVEARPSNKPLNHFDFNDVRTLLASEIDQRQVTLDWQLDTMMQELSLPAALVRQVFFNVLLNALQASPTGGVIEVRVSTPPANEQLIITVCNQGDAIPAERIPQLFEPFISGRTEGHGLGLWVSYQIVQQLKGKISVQSDAQQTCFQVNLPYGFS